MRPALTRTARHGLPVLNTLSRPLRSGRPRRHIPTRTDPRDRVTSTPLRPAPDPILTRSGPTLPVTSLLRADDAPAPGLARGTRLGSRPAGPRGSRARGDGRARGESRRGRHPDRTRVSHRRISPCRPFPAAGQGTPGAHATPTPRAPRVCHPKGRSQKGPPSTGAQGRRQSGRKARSVPERARKGVGRRPRDSAVRPARVASRTAATMAPRAALPRPGLTVRRGSGWQGAGGAVDLVPAARAGLGPGAGGPG